MRRAARLDARYVGPGSLCLTDRLAGARGLRSMLVRRAALALTTFAVATFALAAPADAFVYWANSGTNSIARANLDGTGADQSFITGANAPEGVAVDGAHIYWANRATIGRANLDGTGANQDFITGAPNPSGVAVDGAHVYWANSQGGTIGRANLDGTDVNQNFITGAYAPAGVAVDGAHVYWTNWINATGTGAIGRANLDGTGAFQSFNQHHRRY
jgi:virginiamycin B lyase